MGCLLIKSSFQNILLSVIDNKQVTSHIIRLAVRIVSSLCKTG